MTHEAFYDDGERKKKTQNEMAKQRRGSEGKKGKEERFGNLGGNMRANGNA